MSKRQGFGKWMSALATLVLLLLATNAGAGNWTFQSPVLPAANGLGPPAQSNEAGNIGATAGRSLRVAKETKTPGSKKTLAILDGICVQSCVAPVFRNLQLAHTPSHAPVSSRITSARAPPVPAFAI